MRKGIFIGLLLAAVVSMVSASAIAQDSGDQQSAQAGERGAGRRQFDPQKRTEMLTKELKLTSDQQTKVLDILKSQQSQMQGLHSDTSMSQDDRRSKMMDIRKTSNDQIRALLDPNQQKKWDAMQSRRERWGNKPEGQGEGDSQPK